MKPFSTTMIILYYFVYCFLATTLPMAEMVAMGTAAGKFELKAIVGTTAGTTAGTLELTRVPVKAVRRAMTAFNSSCFLTISASREANTHGNYLAHE